jgi:hypothetical protein
MAMNLNQIEVEAKLHRRRIDHEELRSDHQELYRFAHSLQFDDSFRSPFALSPDGDNFEIASGIVVTSVIPYTGIDMAGQSLSLGASTKVWLKMKIKSDFTTEGCTLETGGVWPAYATYSGGSPPVQTEATCRVGHVVSDDLPRGAPGFPLKKGHFIQLLTSNVAMTACAIDGKATMLPLPFAG